jgi:eukaryotic-like serine/threonine-protein kinase
MADALAALSDALAGRYLVERELGRGGMATVYLAQDLRHARAVAIKVLKPEIASIVGPERFQREIRLAAGFTHPHILPLLDSGEADGLLYYVMPFMAGESLRDRLVRERQLPLPEAARIATDVAAALAHAHGQGVVHRDIKPENILLERGEAVVADFGIARALSPAPSESVTTAGLVLGTPAYMSPEQAAGDATIDGRSDIFALGCVLYEMLAGEPPFTGPTSQAIFGKLLNEQPRSLCVVRPTLPREIEAAVLKALEKDPERRPANAGLLVSLLA